MVKKKKDQGNPVEEFFKAFGDADAEVDFKFGHEVFSEKLDVISTTSHVLDDALSSGGLPLGRLLQYYGPPGCHAPDQGILMADGSVKKAKDVLVGDQVMGADGSERNVLELHSGISEMFEVNPSQGNSHTISDNHILTLNRNNKFFSRHLTRDRNRSSKSGQKRNKLSNLTHLLNNDSCLVDIPLREWMSFSSNKKRGYSLQRYSVDFSKKNLDIPPYILGILLGDGSLQYGVGLTTTDEEIVNEFTNYSTSLGLTVSKSKNENKIPFYKASGVKFKENIFFEKIKKLSLNVSCGDKFIPFEYKTSSRSDRLELLAGILDSDGHFNGSNFDFISKSEKLSNDVAFVARSVGLSATISTENKSAHKDHVGTYYRVYINGKLSAIPCRLSRKQGTDLKKDCSKTGFRINSLGEGQYFGFAVDGDNRYLLDDFTVTHNSGKTFMTMLAIRQAQKADPKAIQIFIDAEQTFNASWAAQLGISVARVGLIQGETAAYGQKLFERLLGVPKEDKKHKFVGKSKPGLLDKIADGTMNVNMIVLDSIGVLIPPGMDTAAVGQITMGKKSKFFAEIFPKLAVEVKKANIPFIMINHVRAGMDPYGPDHTFAGGNSYAHALSANVYFEAVQRKDSNIYNDNEEKIGGIIRAVVEKSKFGPWPRKCEFKVDYRSGVVESHEEVGELAIKYDIVQRPNNVMYEYGEKKWKGRQAFNDAIKNDESLQKNLLDKINSAREVERSRQVEKQEKLKAELVVEEDNDLAMADRLEEDAVETVEAE